MNNSAQATKRDEPNTRDRMPYGRYGHHDPCRHQRNEDKQPRDLEQRGVVIAMLHWLAKESEGEEACECCKCDGIFDDTFIQTDMLVSFIWDSWWIRKKIVGELIHL